MRLTAERTRGASSPVEEPPNRVFALHAEEDHSAADIGPLEHRLVIGTDFTPST
jgi:hypothetical protein